MSDTPKTDRHIVNADGLWTYELRDFMRDLERELNAANAEIERLKSKSCDFCNETPQTENEKLFLEKYGDAPASKFPSTDESRSSASNAGTGIRVPSRDW
jgi:hypothetical protein